MTRSLLKHVVQWLNAFPLQQSRYALGPSTIVMGTPQPAFNKPQFPFGSYAMVYVGTRNDITSRSIPAIALQESNDFGGFYLMSLETGINGVNCQLEKMLLRKYNT